MMKQVVQVIARSDFKVYVYFSDGKIKLYDMNPLISKGGVFKKISKIEDFERLCTVINGTLAWDIGGNFDEYNCIDISPDTIYEDGAEVADPLEGDVA